MIQSNASLLHFLMLMSPHTPCSWCLLTAEGKDTAQFLHKQLSNVTLDINTQIVLHAYCTPQGRVLATLFAWAETPTRYRLLLPEALSTSFVTRLRKFILRDKVSLTPQPDLPLAYIPGPHPYPTGHHLTQEQLTLLPLSPLGYFLVGATDRSHHEEAWQQHLIQLGWPLIQTPELQDQFVPHVLCLDDIQAISFDKGCYPGQEIVARTHYRGKVKKHAVSCLSPNRTAVQPGMSAEEVKGLANGIVINASVASEQQYLQLILPDSLLDTHFLLRIGEENFPCTRLQTREV